MSDWKNYPEFLPKVNAYYEVEVCNNKGEICIEKWECVNGEFGIGLLEVESKSPIPKFEKWYVRRWREIEDKKSK